MENRIYIESLYIIQYVSCNSELFSSIMWQFVLEKS